MTCILLLTFQTLWHFGAGIYFCYLYYGVLQEDLMTSKYGGKSFQEVFFFFC